MSFLYDKLNRGEDLERKAGRPEMPKPQTCRTKKTINLYINYPKQHKMNILITGGNRGLGKEVARQLALKDPNNKILITARDVEEGKEAVAELESSTNNNNIDFIQVDVTSTKDIKNAYQYIAQEWRHLDVLVNNAGIFPRESGDTTQVSLETIQTTFDTNFYGPLQLSQTFLPLLQKSNDARIINVSSGMGALTGMQGGYAAYRFSKTALNSLTAVMAADVAKDNIKVFAVSPGWVKTDMGGPNADRSLEVGGKSIACLVDLPDAISGKFYRDGELIDW